MAIRLNSSADTFKSKLVGVTYEGRQRNIERAVPGQELFWKHEENNPYDRNAIMVYLDKEMTYPLGHLNKKLAKNVVKRMWKGYDQSITAGAVTGGKYPRRLGLNIILQYSKDDEVQK